MTDPHPFQSRRETRHKRDPRARGVRIESMKGSARYMLADDDFLGEDLDWAGFTFAHRTAHGFRYRKVTSAS